MDYLRNKEPPNFILARSNKKQNMKRKCEFQDCMVSASFTNCKGDGKRCKKHSIPGDRNVKCKICIVDNCYKRATRGPRGGNPLRCMNHAIDSDVSSHRPCYVEGCKVTSSFGLPGLKPISCKKHKLFSHVSSNTCEFFECYTIPVFGNVGSKPVRCLKHRHMFDVDVRNRVCEHYGCKKRPVFGMKGFNARRCKLHKFDWDVNVNKKNIN